MSTTIMERLKSATKPDHDSAEGHRFQAALANGRLKKEQYVQYLEQLYLIHSSLEGKLREKIQAGLIPAQVVTEEQMQERFLLHDLTYFEVNMENLPILKATAQMIEYIDTISSTEPYALLGMHYVLLGSKHGGKFIAHNISKTYGLQTIGALYFDPYGSEFMELWLSFKASMNDLSLSQDQEAKILEAAGKTFRSFGELGDELYSAMVA